MLFAPKAVNIICLALIMLLFRLYLTKENCFTQPILYYIICI
jgi:hypothetical protein